MEIIGRKEAKERGLKRYFTDKECKHGHVSERRVTSRRCCECDRDIDRRISEERRKRRELRTAPSPEEIQLRKDKAKQKKKEWLERPEVKERMRKYHREYSQRPDQKAMRKKYKEENKDYFQRLDKERRNKNIEYYREYDRNRYYSNAERRKAASLRGSLTTFIRRMKVDKTDTTLRTFGYSISELSDSLNSKMSSGMSWDNHGEWHIDHIYPVARFLRDGIDCPKIVNSLDNLIPMWAEHNIAKSDKTLEEWLEEKGEDSEEYRLYSRFL